MGAKKKQPAPALRKLYAWEPERKANRALIRHHIRQAMRNKIWAHEKAGPDWYARASDMSRTMADQYKAQSIKTLARASLEYHRLRAHQGLRAPAQGSHCPSGWPWDRPAHELWNKLQREGAPA